MAKPDPALSVSQRPWSHLYVLIFALFSATALYLMRIETALHGIPVGFEEIMATGKWGDGTPLKTTFTGFAAVDTGLSVLVAAFLSGAAGWDAGIWLQHVHFLANFFAVLAIINVEACRKRNAGSWLSYTALWAIPYQTIGGAVFIPLYFLAAVLVSRRDDYYFSGREVSLGHARALLPALVIGYLIPTIALYTPWGDLVLTQNLAALWQPAPTFPNFLLFLLTPLLSSSVPGISTAADIKHLKLIYAVIGIVSAVTQVGTLYLCFTSTNPQLSWRYVFVPNKATWDQSTGLSLHYIFQWDWVIIYASALVWAWISVMDVLRIRGNGDTLWVRAVAALNLVWVALLGGPGTALALTWSWREDHLHEIQKGERTYKKLT